MGGKNTEHVLLVTWKCLKGKTKANRNTNQHPYPLQHRGQKEVNKDLSTSFFGLDGFFILFFNVVCCLHYLIIVPQQVNPFQAAEKPTAGSDGSQHLGYTLFFKTRISFKKFLQLSLSNYTEFVNCEWMNPTRNYSR